MEFFFVTDTFELSTRGDKSSVGLFHVALLIHNLGDLLGHHLGHLLAHIVFQLIQVV